MHKLLIIGLALFLPVHAGAQEATRTEMVPRELAIALIGGIRAPGDGEPEIRVGQPAPSLPSAVLHPGDRVLGSVVRRTGSTTAIASPLEPDSAAARIAQALLRSGWTEPTHGFPTGGFIPSEMARPRLFCAQNVFLNLMARTRTTGGGSHLLVTQDSGAYTPCGRQGEATIPGTALGGPEPPIPALRAPDGVVARISGSGRGQHHAETSARLQTTRSAQELVAHYGAQLRQAGWTPSFDAAGSGTAVLSVRLQQPAGETWQGLLTAVELPGTAERDVAFRVMRSASNRALGGR